jgi:hypothetical protein
MCCPCSQHENRLTTGLRIGPPEATPFHDPILDRADADVENEVGDVCQPPV